MPSLVVHLVSPGAIAPRSGWQADDGSARHVVVPWLDRESMLAVADLIVAHGMLALLASQSIVEARSRLVYRPCGTSRLGRLDSARLERRSRRGLRTAWIAAPDRDTGRVTANLLRLDDTQVTVIEDDDHCAWNELTSNLLDGDGNRECHPLCSGTLVTGRTGVSNRLRARPPRTPPNGTPSRVLTPEHDDGDTTPFPSPPKSVVRDPLKPLDGPRPVNRAATQPVDAPRTVNGAANLPVATPRTLSTGSVDPSSPGHAWWKYRPLSGGEPPRPPANGRAAPPPIEPPPTGESTPDPAPLLPPASDGYEVVSKASHSGVAYFFVGAIVLATVGVASQLGADVHGALLVPIGGVFLALAAARRLVRTHPGEPWLGYLVVLATIAKVGAAYARYFNLTDTYNGTGDAATTYDDWGRRLADAWLNGGYVPQLNNMRKTNFVRWFTGVVYYVFGPDLLTATFVFALLALIGSYFWYRATVDAVPFIDRRLYFALVMFAPSVLFWPALVGKEALMQLGLGALALATSLALRQRLFAALPIALGGGWLVWVVRPHLLALMTIGAGAAYFVGRVRKGSGKSSFVSRPVGIIVLAFALFFTINQGAQSLGITSLSASGIQAELDQTTAHSDQGGSKYSHGDNSLNPLYLPRDAMTVLLRPFPWEAEKNVQLLAALEGVGLAALLVLRFQSLRIALARSRETPLLMFCFVFIAIYCVAFASFANFGLLVRQRSLVLPAVFVLLAVDPALERQRRGEQELEVASEEAVDAEPAEAGA